MNIKDGLLAITTEVLRDIQKEAQAVILDAENEAKQTLKEAKGQAEQDFQDIITQSQKQAEVEKRKIASLTEVEIRNQLLQTKDDLVDEAFKRANSKLEEFTRTTRYHDYLLDLIAKAAKKVTEKRLLVEVNAADKLWLTQESLNLLGQKLQRELILSDGSGIFIGGCIIQTEDGKMSYDSTIENMLQELKPTLRVEIAKMLFEAEA